MTIKTALPTDPAARKRLQLYTFMFQYFPEAFLAVVDVARAGNEQHNPGQPLHWARGKSTDQMNAMFNHVFDYGLGAKKDTDGCYHLAKAIWRLSAQLQLDIEADRAATASVPNPVPEPKPGTVTEICGKVIKVNAIMPDTLCHLARGHYGLCAEAWPKGERL
jgi:hypothetical protein